MAQRIAEFDWSSTPLGPMNRWPESLRTAVGICLASPVPSFVWWGPELINIYNDAYAPLLGGKHPGAVGMPARKVWGSVWSTIADDVDAAMKDGISVVRDRVRFVMKRKSFPDEMFFTYTLSPIPNRRGQTIGLFQVAIDETARVIADREIQAERAHNAQRLRLEQAELESSLARWQDVIANMAEGVILADANGQLLDWNRAALEMHGYKHVEDARVHLTDIAADFQLSHPDGTPVPFSDWPMSRVLRGQAFRNLELQVTRPGSEKKLVVMYNGTLIRDAGGTVRFALLTLHDATESRPTRAAQAAAFRARLSRVQDQRYRRSAKAADTAETLLHNMDITYSEREFCKTLGQHLVKEAIEAYLKAAQQSQGYEGSCIAASLAIAMIIVNDF